MRRLAAFAGGFSLGVFLAQYLLRGGWILAGAGLALALGFLSKLLPWEWRRRGVILCAALALGLGWSWLYARQVQRPAQEMAGRRSDFTATFWRASPARRCSTPGRSCWIWRPARL